MVVVENDRQGRRSGALFQVPRAEGEAARGAAAFELLGRLEAPSGLLLLLAQRGQAVAVRHPPEQGAVAPALPAADLYGAMGA